jgi:hypothetical protein
VNVELNTADLEHLVFICAVAKAYYEREYGLPMENYWIAHAERYQRMFNDLLTKADG